MAFVIIYLYYIRFILIKMLHIDKIISPLPKKKKKKLTVIGIMWLRDSK